MGVCKDIWGLGFRMPVPNNEVFGLWGIAIIVQIFGKHLSIRYLDPSGKS